MKIAMLAPIAWRTPPVHYGPWELVTSMLTEQLIKNGIEVTLFATGNSLTQATLKSVVDQGYEEDRQLDAKVWECLHISQCFELANDFDIIHNQFDFLPLSYSKLVKTPIITTIHGISSDRIIPVYQKYNDHTHYISISNADRIPQLDYLETIYHGIDIDQFSFSNEPQNYLLYYGRIHPDKGTKEAIEVAQTLDKPLLIAGIIQDQNYFDTQIKPHLLQGKIEYIGSVGADQRNQLLGNALALLHLINFDEPFGLSVVEAMACGTPTIAIKRGSMSEIIIDGYNGYLVNTIEQAIEKASQITKINRINCRKHAEHYFSKERMCKDYINVYEKILGLA